MEVEKKKIAAITSAVHAYLQAQQQAAMAQQRVAPPQPMFSPWAMAGRAAAMEMRRNWQLRLVR